MNPEPKQLAAIVLAAGGSSRLGQPKQLIHHKGEALIQRAVRLARGVCDQGVVTVLGAHADRLESLLQGAGSQIIRNELWQAGLASSLSLGLSQISPPAEAVLLMLCDQPQLSRVDISRLTEAWRAEPERPVAAKYNGVLGAPAIVPLALTAELLKSLSGDSGAGVWLRGRGDVRPVSMQNAALDLDTPDDLTKLAAEELNK